MLWMEQLNNWQKHANNEEDFLESLESGFLQRPNIRADASKRYNRFAGGRDAGGFRLSHPFGRG